MMRDRELQRLFYHVNANPLESPFFLFRRWNALPWFSPKPVPASIMFIDMSSSVLAKADHDEVWQENIYTLHSRASRIIRTCHNLGITLIPQMLIIDRQGIVRSVDGLDDADTLLPQLLAQPVGK